MATTNTPSAVDRRARLPGGDGTPTVNNRRVPKRASEFAMMSRALGKLGIAKLRPAAFVSDSGIAGGNECSLADEGRQ